MRVAALNAGDRVSAPRRRLARSSLSDAAGGVSVVTCRVAGRRFAMFRRRNALLSIGKPLAYSLMR